MDFTRIPFNAALDRLYNLLPIGPAIRLQSVKPCLPLNTKRCFFSIKTNVERDYLVALQFSFPHKASDENGWVVYDPQETVLNRGRVECNYIDLYRADGLPVEAFSVLYQLAIHTTDPGVLAWLPTAPDIVLFDEELPRQTELTFKDVCANLGPCVSEFQVPWHIFPDIDDVSSVELTRRQGEPLDDFKLSIPSAYDLFNWLRNNVPILLDGCFVSHITDVSCTNDEEVLEGWEEDLQKVVHPFCEHEGRNSRRLDVCVYGSHRRFYFTPNCPECAGFSPDD